MERAGQSDKGSITALYTVLVEGDDMTEPVADETRSILDGHIVLSRKLGAAAHYPAVDVLGSVSRVFNQITTPEHRKAASRMRELMAKYQEVELLVRIGEYKKGTDAVTDEAIAKNDAINKFLRQGLHDKASFADTIKALQQLVK
jgi:type III secretion protein N (ATPase)